MLKTTGIFFVNLLLSGSVMAQNWGSLDQSVKTVQKDVVLSREDQTFYDTLYNSDCSVPEGTQILHYPMVHRAPFNMRDVLNMREITSRSQWELLQLIRQYPSALVFSEQYWSESETHSADGVLQFILDSHSQEGNSTSFDSDVSHTSGSESDENVSALQQLDNLVQNVLDNVGKAASFEELHASSKQVLYDGGGSTVALSLGIIDRLYPSTLLSSQNDVFIQYWERIGQAPIGVMERKKELNIALVETAIQYNQEKSDIKKHQLKESFRMLFQALSYLKEIEKDMMFRWREHLLFESVKKTLSEDSNQDKMVIVAYGAGHNFADDFKDYNFYTFPYGCSFLNADDSSLLNVSFSLLIARSLSSRSQKDILYRFAYNSFQQVSDDSIKQALLFSKQEGLIVMSNEEEMSVEIFRKSMLSIINDLLNQSRDDLGDWEMTFKQYVFGSDEYRYQLLESFQRKPF